MEKINPGQLEQSIIIIGSIISITLAVFTLLFFTVFLNKKRKLILDKELMKATFDQTILQAQLEIQEQTFTNISQEIHDNVGQILSLAKVQLNILTESQNADKHLLQDASENISKAMTDLRDIAKGLNSERIKSLGLVHALEQETHRITRSGFLNIQFSIEGMEKEIDQQKQLILFRIVQECFQNIIKHAGASIVQITFYFKPEELQICILDNGKGFNFQQAQNAHQGLGLSNIFKRIELIGGTADIASVIDQGTTTKLNVKYV